MADPRFFQKAHEVLDKETLATLTGIGAIPDSMPLISGVAPLETAKPHDISFLDNKKYRPALLTTKAGACFIKPEYADLVPPHVMALVTPTPYKCYALIAQYFYPNSLPEPLQHPSACIHPKATVHPTCRIEAGVVIGALAEIGAHSHIAPNAVIGDGVKVGEHVVIGANASISHAHIGNHTVIYPGARIGQPGFGFAIEGSTPIKVPQIGRVIIGQHVEVGANTTIDRGASHDTVIGDGVMIDNQVQIAHNVTIGAGSVIVAQVGISGSTRLGQGVIIGGQAGLTGHLEIANGARIAANSGVMRDIGQGQAVGGSPAMPFKEWLKLSALLRRLLKQETDK
jgi:UDP-3-O-[3-hydroxymyristoyl] glucosamine N-acyltransferase